MSKLSIVFVLITVVGITLSRDNSDNDLVIEEIPVTPPFNVGFGGVWDSRNSSIYFVDHYTNFCFRYSLYEEKMYKATVETNFTISFIFPSQQSAKIFFVGAGNTIILVEWNGTADKAKFIKLVSEVEPNTGNIMNHAVAGPLGELLFGTFPPLLCSGNATQGLYQYKKYKSYTVVKTLFTDVYITSGVAIDERLNILYHLDGCAQELTAYDRDYHTGDLSNKRVVIKFHFPFYTLMVGLVIDSNGNLYTGLYGGSALIQMYPRTGKYRKIEMPTPFIGDPGFVGPKNDLVVVGTGTAVPNFSTGQLNTTIDTPLAGSVLKVKGLGVRSSGISLPAAPLFRTNSHQ